MNKELAVFNPENIKRKIYCIRGVQVMLDRDLAELYAVETKQLNRAVKRNKERFPDNFCFQLDENEYGSLKSQYVPVGEGSLRFQFGTSNPDRGGRRYLPYVFTEQGVSMLSGVLRSKTAVRVSIQIINAFVAMRKFISKNAELFSRLDSVERKQLSFEIKTDNNFEKIFTAIEDKSFQKKQGIFFEGQIFDSYKFVSDLIRSADKSIILIDNYVDDSVLTLFSKRNKAVQTTIFTKDISKQLSLDIAKYNSQYPSIELKEFKQSHDRFLIIDNKEVYHFGASLKDLGKRWFAFSKFDKEAFKLLDKLGLK
ncbi:ORF6N domain-containing protein [Candidatus Woesearchaeota archaeon]|nr:ORF6N domain-containing protein [Candidatus Woesearchaeota archaeon]